MRILAVRGENLASLAMPFEVDFEQPPLADAGLFAIAGPTGSGKSTILDVICLALFDRVPRLPGGRGVAVGRASDDEQLRTLSTDVRSLLRRGAGSGFAEVDFLADDGEHYRARWDVRRARRKPGGRLQQQEVSLSRLKDGKALGHTKTEVLEAIRDRLGLTFEQFRRSVLLAQGDFAAFLKSDADERAGLLERITGSELYSEISKAAYRRAADEQTQLETLQARLGDVEPLATEARGRLESRREELRKTISRVESEQNKLLEALRWHEREKELVAEESDAGKALESAEKGWEAAQPRLGYLSRAEEAHSLGPQRDALELAKKAVESVEERLVQLTRSQAAALDQMETAQIAYRTATTRHLDARQQWDNQRQPLREARRLDMQIESKEQQAQTLASQLRSSEDKVDAASARMTQISDALVTARQEAERLESWLEHQGHHERLFQEWARWEEKLRRYTRVSQARKKTKTEWTQMETALQQSRRRSQDARSALARMEKEHAGFKEALAALEVRYSAMSAERISNDRRQLEAQSDGWAETLKLANEFAQLEERVSDRGIKLETAKATETAAVATIADLTAKQPVKQARLDEVSAALELAIASQDAETERLRSRLAPDLPCPVCGAKDHPWAAKTPAFDAHISSQRERQKQLKEEIETDRQALADAKAKRAQAIEAIRDRQTEQSHDDASRRQLERAWDLLSFTGKPDLSLRDTGLIDFARRHLAETRDARQSLNEREQKAETLARDIAGSRAKLEETNSKVRSENLKVHEEERACIEQEGSLRELASRIEAQDTELSEIRASLQGPLAAVTDWAMHLDRDPDDFIEDYADRQRTWQANTRHLEDVRASLSELEKNLAEAKSELANKQSQANEHRRSSDVLNSEITRLRQSRRDFFAGAAADEVEKQLEDAVSKAESEEKAAAETIASARRESAKVDEALAVTRTEFESRKQEQAAAETRLQEVLAQREITLEQFDELMVHDASWLEAEKKWRNDLSSTLERLRVTLNERKRARQVHAQAAPDEFPDDAESVLEALKAEISQHRNEFAEMDLQLRQDDEKRQRSAGLAQELARQAGKSHTWSALNELIGSADGKKFRVFAQSLTLEALLAHANHHLGELSRRYRLQRVPGSDLELQVIDTDMGDEVRSVHSLSGGESFLVSLGLALGLASLSSNRVQVESLFIDEGFGSLDPDALDTAIASLDRLQSLGRKVGVISHVPSLVERVGVRVLVEPQGGGRSRVTVGMAG